MYSLLTQLPVPYFAASDVSRTVYSNTGFILCHQRDIAALKAWRHVYEMSREIAVKELLVLAWRLR